MSANPKDPLYFKLRMEKLNNITIDEELDIAVEELNRRIERKFHSYYEDKNPSAWVPNDRTTEKIDENEADDKFVEFMVGL